MAKRVYRVEIKFHVTSLDVTREEVPVDKIPRWKHEMTIAQESKIEAKNLQEFNQYLKEYGVVNLYGDLLKKMRDIPK